MNLIEPECTMSAFTVRLPDDVSKKLDALAAKLDRSRSYVAVQAIEDFVAREAWQLVDIEAGLREAERGDFASDAEVTATIAKYTKRKRRR
jgi:predicted transcriptional regulator